MSKFVVPHDRRQCRLGLVVCPQLRHGHHHRSGYCRRKANTTRQLKKEGGYICRHKKGSKQIEVQVRPRCEMSPDFALMTPTAVVQVVVINVNHQHRQTYREQRLVTTTCKNYIAFCLRDTTKTRHPGHPVCAA